MASALARETGSGLRSTRNATVPSPCPCDPPVIAIQPAVADADQEHSLDTLTVSELVPPSGPNERGAVSKLGWQRAGVDDGAVTLVADEPPHADANAASPNSVTSRFRVPSERTTGGALHILRHCNHKYHVTGTIKRFPFCPMLSINSRLRVWTLPLALVSHGLALGTLSGCATRYALVQHAPAEPGGLSWFGPAVESEQKQLLRWSSAVGPPLVVGSAVATRSADSIALISWNIALGAGDLEALLADVRATAPSSAVVLLLQEAYREGPEVPTALVTGASFAERLGGEQPDGTREDIDTLARRSGLNLYYVPSMRNGSPTASDEDRGNAILSTLPLDDLTAIELPFERQRRVAVAATAVGQSSDGQPWRIRFVSAHLDNRVGARRLWFAGAMYARARQAKALVESVRDADAAVLGGDFNTWFGFGDLAFTETREAFPDTRVTDRRPTFHNLLRLDHLFFRLPDGWTVTVKRGSRSYGSDHWPLIARIRMR
jgi:endonuclease/exonuclease/phosphatase family metal-dependent hydrolase